MGKPAGTTELCPWPFPLPVALCFTAVCSSWLHIILRTACLACMSACAEINQSKLVSELPQSKPVALQASDTWPKPV